MPVAAFVGQILGESKFMLVKTFIYSALIRNQKEEHCSGGSNRSVVRKGAGAQCHCCDIVTAVSISCRGHWELLWQNVLPYVTQSYGFIGRIMLYITVVFQGEKSDQHF